MKSKKLAIGFITIGFVFGLVCGIFVPSLYKKVRNTEAQEEQKITQESESNFNTDYTDYYIYVNNHSYWIGSNGGFSSDDTAMRNSVCGAVSDLRLEQTISKITDSISTEIPEYMETEKGIIVEVKRPSEYIAIRGSGGLKYYYIKNEGKTSLYRTLREIKDDIEEVNSDDN